MPITIPNDLKQQIMKGIVNFFQDEFDEELGDLKAQIVYEYFVGMIGAAAYNQGVADGQAYLQKRLIDLEIDVHQTVEFDHTRCT